MMRASSRFAVSTLAASLLLCAAATLEAGQCGYAQAYAGLTTGYSQINYVVSGGSVGRALAIWGEGCMGQGTDYPNLSSSTSPLSGPGILNINVSFQGGTSSTQSCGESFLQYSNTTGKLLGGSIVIYQYQIRNGVQTPCGSLPNFDSLIAHEIGHSLGLGDQYTVDPTACLGALMSADPEYVFSDECEIVKASFETPAEMPPHTGSGGIGGPDGCYETDCGGGGPWDPDPLVLDLNGDGIKTTGNENMVWFDLDGNGRADKVTWTRPDTAEGFLWINLSGKNRVDDGTELLGIGTRLPDGSKAVDGFQALAAYDAPAQGGNGDGVIDARDHVWNQLRVWVDENHNGVCEPSEVHPLHAYGVEGISLNYVRTNAVDANGNRHSLQARFWRNLHGQMQFFAVESLTFQGYHY